MNVGGLILVLQEIEAKHGSDLEVAVLNTKWGEHVEIYDAVLSTPNENQPLALRDMTKTIDSEHKFVEVIV